MTACDKYAILNRENLMQQISMQLSQKQKTFSESSSEFLKSRLNFEYFLWNDKRQRWYMSQMTDSEKQG